MTERGYRGMHRFYVGGDDNRARAVESALTGDGYEVTAFEDADIVILPPGVKICAEGKTVFGAYSENGVINYAKDPLFKTLNAIPTAEGAIACAMECTDKTLWRSSVAIVGDGCISKALLPRLEAFLASVTVYARKSGEPIGNLYESDHEIIFNTVPAPVIDANMLQSFKTNPLIIDLASLPGGVDFDAAKELGITALHKLSLPAKCAPVTAGGIIKDTVISLLRGVK